MFEDQGRILAESVTSFLLCASKCWGARDRMKTRRSFALFIGGALSLLFSLAGSAQSPAEQRAIDPETSTITVRVSKTGLFSVFAHNHLISATGLRGVADIDEDPTVAFKFGAGQLRVIDPGASAGDRAEVQHTMEGEKVLDIKQYPEISFKSSSVTKQASDRWLVKGSLAFHGTTREISFEVRENGGRYHGKTMLRLKDFQIEPIRLAGGTVGVKNEVEIEFDVALASKP
jgi:polyisoprenoid-binding protein YceI